MRPLVTVSLLLAASAAAADKPAPAPEKSAPTSTENATAAAKKDFDDVKAARGMPNATGADLPQLSTPELNLGSGAPTPSAARVDPALAAKAKSANWLVDAMMEKPKKGAGQETPDKDKLTNRRLAAGDSATDPATERSEKEKPEDRPKKSENVVNPLDQYMASWVSPQDLSLLRSVMREQNSDGISDPLLASIPGDSAAGARRDALAVATGAAAAAGVMQGAPHDNPFLQLLNTPPPSPSVLAPPPTAAGPMGPSAAPVPALPDPAAAAKSTIPSFVKPRDDEKFNKQMKRF